MIALVMALAAAAADHDCGACTFGKLGVTALSGAPTMGCDNQQTQVLVAAYLHCPGTMFTAEQTTAAERCKASRLEAGAVVEQCLQHTGAAGWAVALTAACSYVALLPVAMMYRPSLTAKCD